MASGHALITPPDNRITVEDTIDGETRITPREAEVLRFLSSGFSNKEVARRLALSVRTVETHRFNLRRKTKTGRLKDLVSLARELGLPPVIDGGEHARRGNNGRAHHPGLTASGLSPKPADLPGRGSIWRHKKGAVYRVVLVSRHTEDPDAWLVSYEPLYGGEVWTRAFTSSRQTDWPAFMDEGRFEYLSGPRTWCDEGELGVIGALARIVREHQDLEAGKTPAFELTPAHCQARYRDLMRIVAERMDRLFDPAN
jgi:DNA-binding CsgD family transcriptional regulator